LNRFLIRENMVTHLANCEVVIIINHPKFGEETKFNKARNQKENKKIKEKKDLISKVLNPIFFNNKAGFSFWECRAIH
jgi:hypothetical protein